MNVAMDSAKKNEMDWASFEHEDLSLMDLEERVRDSTQKSIKRIKLLDEL